MSWLLALAGAVGTVALGLAAGVSDIPILLRDNQHYFFVAERVAAGIPPHVSGFDPKHALSLLLAGAGIGLGDWIGLAPVMSNRLVSLAILALFNALLGVLAYRATGRPIVGVLALALGLSYLNPLTMAAMGGRPKLLLLPLGLGITWAVSQRAWRTAAFTAALCFLTWQPTLLLLLLVGISALADRVRPRTLVWMVAAALAPVALYEAYFWAKDALSTQLFQSYTFPAQYMGHGMGNLLQHLRSFWVEWTRGFARWHPALLVALVTLLVWWIRAIRKPGGWRVWRWHPGWLFLHGAAVTSLAFTVYDHQGPPDLYFPLPFLTIIAALGLAEVLAWVHERIGRGATLAGASMAVLLVGLAAMTHARAWRPTWTLTDQHGLADSVRTWVDRGEHIYAVNAAHLLGMARSDNWLPYSSFFRGVNTMLRDQRGGDAFVPQRDDGSLPDVILVGRGRPYGWPDWLIAAGYQDATSSPFSDQRIAVWRRP